MSFHQNGSRRYGAVPPAQYGAAQDQGHLRRQSSFDNGDDAPFFDNNINPRRGDSSSRTAGTTQSDVWVDPAQNIYQPPTRATSSALSGYQHQFQPSSGSPQQSPAIYNPQQFARTLSQSQQHSAAYHNNAQAYSNTGGSGGGGIAPYNPALYQGQASLQRQPTQSSQSSYNYGQSYASPTVPQSFNYWPTPGPSEHTYNQPQPGPGASYIPLPPKPSAYLPPPQAAPYAPNGSHYPADRPTSQHGRSSQSVRSQGSTELPYPSDIPYRPMPSPTIPQREPSFQGSGLHRHPTLRPLPTAPIEEDLAEEWDETNTYKTAEEIQQERLFRDIDSNLHQSSDPFDESEQFYGDLLDGELEEQRRYDSEATTLYPVSSTQVSTYYDDDSDPEAAAGLQAMRIADEQDALREGGSLFESHNGTPPPPARSGYHDASSDSDYAHANMDIGLYSGGYEGNLSYGGSNLGLNHDHRDEMVDESRPLPMPHEIHRPEEYNPPLGLGGIVPAQGTYGTDLQQTGRQRAYSYDEEDEPLSMPSRGAESRLSGRSGSSSPNKTEFGEFFYGPGPNGNRDRPLPALPSDIEPGSRAGSGYRPTGTYGPPNDSQHSWNYDTTQPNFPANAYDQLLSPTGQQLSIPRSASHTSSSNHPRAIPPTRAKTDAEERQAAKHRTSKYGLSGGRAGAGSLDGYDSGTLASSDLPTLPARKKFKAEKLSSNDYKKCSEPWALSSVAGWLKEMCGGETDDVDYDLREHMLREGLVNLFTHKVPTMNTTDAETLSELVIKEMFQAGLLIREEEWVKIGSGEISGVLWQLTGSGCYSPRIHDHDVPGRCYSHHCSRTLKKITLQPSEASRKKEDWETFYKITDEQKKGKSKKEIERQHVIHEVVMSEHTFMDALYVLGVVYRDGLLSSQPPVITPTRLPRVVEEVYGRVEAIKKVNEDYLLPQLKYKQQMEGPWISGCGDVFREWIRKARQAYISYAVGLPNAIYKVKKEMERNILFLQFLNSAREHELSGRLSWDSFLKAPTTRLQRYTLLLGTVLKTMQEDSEEKATLEKAIEEIKQVTIDCNNKFAEMEKVIELRELNDKLMLRPGMGPQDLSLKDPQRELLFRGELLRAGNNRFTWLETHALLYDHYFILAKVVPSKDHTAGKRGERYDVSKPPIPMQLLILEGANDDPVVKRDVKGIGAVTTAARTNTPTNVDARARTSHGERPYGLNHTNTNTSIDSIAGKSTVSTTLETDEKRMYPFRIKHLGRSDVYTLFASSAKMREEWCGHIVAAKTRHAASLHEQNAEPFSMRVIADSAFAYDDATAASMRDPGAPVRETPLYRAIREIEDTYGPMRPGPVCRAQVNCGTGFTAYGKAMLAIGTDYGVFTSEVSNPRGWTRVITTTHVTQIAVLEEFSIFLIIANKSLIAHHLDVVVPVSNFPPPHNDSVRKAPQKLSSSNVAFFATCRLKDRTLVIYKKKENTNSIFKILEPILQKSTEKKAKMFGRKLLGGGATEFFREFDEFYIPAESYGVNIFNKSIAIPTTRGVELLTLDSKVTITVPNANSSFEAIAPRLKGQKPLGMFRLDENDFMLVYEDCGVYIDKYGDISRSVILELIGKAKSATMYEGYLLLFNDDFVEVRDSKTGRLRQIVAGRDIRCLDAGVEGRGEGGHRSVKIAMSHPEHVSVQLVLELVLNDDSREWKG